jgi:hypothetical protein
MTIDQLINKHGFAPATYVAGTRALGIFQASGRHEVCKLREHRADELVAALDIDGAKVRKAEFGPGFFAVLVLELSLHEPTQPLVGQANFHP